MAIILGFILGTILGSFAKATADRSLSNRKFTGRSYCPRCKHVLHWYDLFPVVSYLVLRGKCRYCHKIIGFEYLLVEVIMGLLISFLFWKTFTVLRLTINDPQFAYTFSIVLLTLIFNIFFITILTILFITDIKKMFIPDRVIIPAIWIGLIYLTIVTIYKIGYLYYLLNQSVIGKLLLPPHSDYFQRHVLYTAEPLILNILTGVLISGFFLGLIIITKGKGMGGGDVKLGALMGLTLGFSNGILALMLSFLSGALVSIVLVLFGKKHFGQSVPFGPFLVLGSLIALFWGNEMINWYLHLSF